MTGTMSVQVMRCCSTRSKKPPGSNDSMTWKAPPDSMTGATSDRAACDSGVGTAMRISSGNSHSDIWIHVIDCHTRWLISTPLGRPVVPPV